VLVRVRWISNHFSVFFFSPALVPAHAKIRIRFELKPGQFFYSALCFPLVLDPRLEARDPQSAWHPQAGESSNLQDPSSWSIRRVSVKPESNKSPFFFCLNIIFSLLWTRDIRRPIAA